MNYKNLLSMGLQLLIAVIYLQTLYFKFMAHPDSVYIFSQLGAEPYGRIGLGVIELVTAVLILVPRTKIWGLMISLGIITGAIFSHLLVIGLNVQGDSGVLFGLAIVVLLATLLLLWMHQAEVQNLINQIFKK